MGIKTCVNGHKFDNTLPECPFCPKPSKSMKTEFHELQSDRTLPDRAPVSGASAQASMNSSAKKTVVEKPSVSSAASRKTVILSGDPARKADASPGVKKPQGKLVGWLATFSWNRMGQAYQVNEGRTRIGSDKQSDVCVDDAMMSGNHSQMIYRNGILEIQDSFSTNGTIVNGVDIRGERTELKDGDILKMGNTVFKLRLIGEIPNE